MALEWVLYGGELGLKFGLRLTLNICLPGSGSAVDFLEAVKCFYDGDNIGGVLSIGLGVADLLTLGAASTAEEAMKETAKGAVVQTAKETAKSAGKEATKKVGQNLSKQIAMGTINCGKDAAIQTANETAKSAAKEATKKVGQDLSKQLAMGAIKCGKDAAIQTANETAKSAAKEATKKAGQDLSKQLAMGAIKCGKDAAIQTAKETAKTVRKLATKKVGQKVATEIARGVVPNVVDEVWRAGTKMTVGKMTVEGLLAAISSGGREATKTTLEAMLRSGMENIIFETMKQSNKKVVFGLTKDAAKTAARKEFTKHSYRFITKDVIFSGVKGVINWYDQ